MKRFEGSDPTFRDMVAAFETMGLMGLLGVPGPATAYATRLMSDEAIQLSVIPGHFTAREIEDLREWAA